jgi:hypothetical protein
MFSANTPMCQYAEGFIFNTLKSHHNNNTHTHDLSTENAVRVRVTWQYVTRNVSFSTAIRKIYVTFISEILVIYSFVTKIILSCIIKTISSVWDLPNINITICNVSLKAITDCSLAISLQVKQCVNERAYAVLRMRSTQMPERWESSSMF